MYSLESWINIKVKQEEIDAIKNKYDLTYFETSAKDNINIQNLFEYLIKTTIKKRGNLKNIGLPEDASLDDIKITIKENQKLETKIQRPKKKKFCWNIFNKEIFNNFINII